MTQPPVNYGKFASFTRGDLIRTIEKLLERELSMLNKLAQMQHECDTEVLLPWVTKDT